MATGRCGGRGTMTVGTTGGNVPFGCVVRRATGSYNVGCAVNEVAIGGGGRCDSSWVISESLPWGGAADGQPFVEGQPARGWRSACQLTGFGSGFTPPQGGTFAICCRQ